MAWADANDDLRAEVNALKERLSQLERKLAEQTQPATAGGHSWHETTPIVTFPSLMQGIGISGTVDSTYSYNFNSPDSNNIPGVFKESFFIPINNIVVDEIFYFTVVFHRPFRSHQINLVLNNYHIVNA